MKAVDKWKALARKASARASKAAAKAKELQVIAKASAAGGGIVGGYLGPTLSGRMRFGEGGDDKLGTDATPYIVGALTMAGSVAVGGVLGVAIASAGGAMIGSAKGMRDRLEGVELLYAFRKATVPKEK